MKIKATIKRTLSILLVTGLLLGSPGVAQATRPIGGNTHSFAGSVNVGATTGDARTLAAGDLDNDGYADLLYGAGVTLAVTENDGTPLDGWPAADQVGVAQNTITDVAPADFDHDGWLDIASVTGGTGNNEVKLWQNPALPFTSSWTVSNTLTSSLPISLTSVAAADLDVDSFADLVVGGSDGNIRLWANPLTTAAPFNTSWSSPIIAASASGSISDLAVADVDRDGKTDIVAVAGSTVRIWRNPGAPFTTPWTVSNTLGSLSSDAISVVPGDLDGDGWLDVAVGDAAGNVTLWRNPLTTGAPFITSWGSGVDVGDAAGAINALFAADLDTDGDLDLIGGGGSSAQTWQNDGAPFNGAWSLTTAGTIADTIYTLSVADVDRDGDADVVSGSGDAEDYEIVLWPNTLVHHALPFRETGHVAGTINARFRAIVSADLDKDGDLDLITGSDSHAGYELVAWENNGSPFVTAWNPHNIGDLSTVYGVAAGDLDNDGDVDIVSGQDASPCLVVWQNDGAPFEGAWSGHVVSNASDRVNNVALGDLDNDGDLDIVAAIGSPTGKVTAWQNDSSPFSGAWSYNDVYTVTYSVNAVALGDLDNDGWLDVVIGSSHAPGLGTADNPVDPSLWPDVYELRAYQNDQTPFTGVWTQTNVGRDPETVTFATGHYHGYWGATIFSVALADLDNDGDLDIATTDHLEADYQVKVWQNDGTPFSGEQWLATAGGVYAPWMSSSVYDVATGDINNDGYVDLVTVSAEFYETVVWENDGRPFGAVISDTTWIRHDLGQYTSEGALAVEIGDLDQDGDLDIAHGSGLYYSAGDLHDLVAWLNQSGSAKEGTASTAPAQLLEGATDDLLGVNLSHQGISADHDIELTEWRLLLEASTGVPLTSAQANAIVENLYVYRDANGNRSWEATDTRILTVSTLSLTDGVQTITFADGDPLVQVSPHGSSAFFVVVQATSNASYQSPNTLTVTFDPDADSIVQDRAADTSVSIQDTEPIHTGLVTFVGPATRALVEDLPTSSGNEVFTATLGSGNNLTVYANSHDNAGNFRANVAVAWSLTNVMGNVVGADLTPAGDNRSATFTAHQIGAARILANHATLTDDATGFITVTLQVTATPNPAPVGDNGGALVMATLVNENLTAVADGTIVTFTTSLGSFGGQTTVTRATTGGLATAILTSAEMTTARITVTGNDNTGWTDVSFGVGNPYTVTLTANPTTMPANGVATSTITATIVDQYAHPVADGTVVTFTTSLGSLPVTPYTVATSNGVATATLTAGVVSGQAIVAADAGAAQGQTTVQLTAGEPVTLTLTANPSSIAIGGQTSTVSATVQDEYGNPVTNGTVVTFTTNLGSFPATPYAATTSNGVATASLTSGDTLGQATVTAAVGAIQNHTTIQFTPATLHHFDLQAPSSGTAGQPFTLTITARDASGNAIANFTGNVTLSTTNGGVISPTAAHGADFVAGVWSGPVTLSAAGQARVVIVSFGGVSSQTSIDLSPGQGGPYQIFLPLLLRNH